MGPPYRNGVFDTVQWDGVNSVGAAFWWARLAGPDSRPKRLAILAARRAGRQGGRPCGHAAIQVAGWATCILNTDRPQFKLGRGILLGSSGPDPCGLAWALVGRALVGLLGPLWAGPLGAPLGPCGPGLCGFPWALVGQAPVASRWALVDRALVGPPGPLWATWALGGRARVSPLGPCGPPGGHLWAGPLWALWALLGQGPCSPTGGGPFRGGM